MKVYLHKALVLLLACALSLTAFAGASRNGKVASFNSNSVAPSKIPLPQNPTLDNARAAKERALDLVAEMQYPDPDRTPPGKDFRKAYIQLELAASIDGTFRGNNYLQDIAAFDHDINAAKRLLNMLSDPKVDDSVKSLATQALQEIVDADRLITIKALESLSVFGQDLPEQGVKKIEKALLELEKGDDKAAKGMAVDAIRDYRKAWDYTSTAIEIIWASQDADGDRVIDRLEHKLGTDLNAADTDRDGLSDGEEFTRTGTDPTQSDTDGDGISDSDQDSDGDGLSNREEILAGTHPLRPDSDGDSLDDNFELQISHTDPLKQDTDADGLTDDSEYRLGTDPENPDSDGDGTLDGFQVYTSTAATNDTAVRVEMTGQGDVARAVTIRELSDDVRFQNLPGQLSSAYDITSEKSFANARVKIHFDPAAVPNGDYDGLQILYYDELARTFFALDAHGVDVENGYVWADSSHFTVFVLFYMPNWKTAWTHPMDTGRDNNFIDIMLVLDSSGSMSWNDPNGYRKIAAKRFIDGLLEEDRAGVVDFDHWAKLYQPLTSDFGAAKAAVDRIDASGGTNIGAAVRLANSHLIANSNDPERLRAEILLTDGDGDYDPALTAQAADENIVIYTIGLGYWVNPSLLKSIAAGTGGVYFPVASAEQLPDVFKRIIDEEGEDSDGDGLSDALESNGIRLGTGEIIHTDPNNPDTDGDGVSDGEELGGLASSPWGEYYPAPSNPLYIDSDGDGLTDDEEEDYGTNPYQADSDGDGLSDPLELDNEFDPNDRNPDGDHRDDFDEWTRDSDPFYYNYTSLEHGVHVVAGLVLGEAGENFANLGWIDHETIQSFGYLGGWLLSGLVVVGDIRDTLAALVRGDLADTFLNAAGLVPLLGDAARTAGVVAKWMKWSDNIVIPLTRWIAKTFAEVPASARSSGTRSVRSASASGGNPLFLQLLGLVGASPALINNVPYNRLVDLAHYRNDLTLLSNLVQQGLVSFSSRSLNTAAWARVGIEVNKWPQHMLHHPDAVTRAKNRAQAISVEAAVEVLKTLPFDILYLERGWPVPMVNGPAKSISQGPDIVALNRDTGLPVVIEVKGAVVGNDMVLTGKRLKSKVGNNREVMTSHVWIDTNKDARYLNAMKDATDSNINQAAALLEDIADNRAPYESLIIGYGSGSGSRFGKIDETLNKLSQDASTVGMILIDP